MIATAGTTQIHPKISPGFILQTSQGSGSGHGFVPELELERVDISVCSACGQGGHWGQGGHSGQGAHSGKVPASDRVGTGQGSGIGQGGHSGQGSGIGQGGHLTRFWCGQGSGSGQGGTFWARSWCLNYFWHFFYSAFLHGISNIGHSIPPTNWN